MKKFKMNFDYKLFDCVAIVIQCAIVGLLFAGGAGFIAGIFLGTELTWLGFIIMVLGYFISGIYTIICIARYIIEGITITQIAGDHK